MALEICITNVARCPPLVLQYHVPRSACYWPGGHSHIGALKSTSCAGGNIAPPLIGDLHNAIPPSTLNADDEARIFLNSFLSILEILSPLGKVSCWSGLHEHTVPCSVWSKCHHWQSFYSILLLLLIRRRIMRPKQIHNCTIVHVRMGSISRSWMRQLLHLMPNHKPVLHYCSSRPSISAHKVSQSGSSKL